MEEDGAIICDQCDQVVNSTFGGLCKKCQLENERHREIVSAIRSNKEPAHSGEICPRCFGGGTVNLIWPNDKTLCPTCNGAGKLSPTNNTGSPKLLCDGCGNRLDEHNEVTLCSDCYMMVAE